MLAVLLTGDHDTLPRAELEAQVGPTQWIGDRVAIVPDDARIGSLAYLKQASTFWAEAADTEEGLMELAKAVATCAAGVGSAAIQTTRTGTQRQLTGADVIRSLGAALVAAGHTIDLAAPSVVVTVWFHAGRIIVGQHQMDGATDHDDRGVEHRAHFSPISLRPRLARALVHITGQRPGATIYDPFCGTGGILLEAALAGYQVLGSDRDPWMVQGTLATLADAGPEPLDGDIFEADIGDAPKLAGHVDAIVTDLPYGGASTTNQEAIQELYSRAFDAFAAMLPPGGRAVIGHANADLLAGIETHGFELECVHEEYVHKSLTRRFAVVKRTS